MKFSITHSLYIPSTWWNGSVMLKFVWPGCHLFSLNKATRIKFELLPRAYVFLLKNFVIKFDKQDLISSKKKRSESNLCKFNILNGEIVKRGQTIGNRKNQYSIDTRTSMILITLYLISHRWHCCCGSQKFVICQTSSNLTFDINTLMIHPQVPIKKKLITWLKVRSYV